jgi:hypothetical protein
MNEGVAKHIQKRNEHITNPIAITLSASDQNDARFSVKRINANPTFADCVLSIKTADVYVLMNWKEAGRKLSSRETSNYEWKF